MARRLSAGLSAACHALAVVILAGAVAWTSAEPAAAAKKNLRPIEGCGARPYGADKPLRYGPDYPLRVTETLRIAGYVVEVVEQLQIQYRRVEGKLRRFVERDEFRMARIRKNGVYLDCVVGDHITVIDRWGMDPFDWRQHDVRPRLGANITGGRAPNLLVLDSTYATFAIHVFELGRTLVKLGEIDGGESEIFSFHQLDDDRALEAILTDGAYIEWRAGRWDSARPMVILKLDRERRRYRFAAELMRLPPPSPAYLDAFAREVREDWIWDEPKRVPSDRVPPLLAQGMLDLIYSGNFPAARRLLELAWNPTVKGRDEYYIELIECMLRRSRYWPEIAAFNQLPADEPNRIACSGI